MGTPYGAGLGPHYNYPNLVTESWESDSAFAGVGPNSTIAFSKVRTSFFTGTSVAAYVPARRMRLVDVGWNLAYLQTNPNPPTGGTPVWSLRFEKNGSVAATHTMATPNAGLPPTTVNVGSGRFSAEVDLIPGTDYYGISGTKTSGDPIVIGLCTVNLVFEVLG